jgi:ABC-type iron transport system FetAB ATPase subunit
LNPVPTLRLTALGFLDWAPTTLEVGAGEIVGLRGASGSGKTLLLRAVADLIPRSGAVALGDDDALSLAGHAWRRRVGYLPAESLWWREKVGEHFPAGSQPALEPLGLPAEVMEWSVTRLSQGERQRLGLLRLLVRGPEALLLDEPTANLDERSAAAVERMILAYVEERQAPVIWVSHSLEQLRRVASRVLLMVDRRVEVEDDDG